MTTNTSSTLNSDLRSILEPLSAVLTGLEPKDVPLPEVTGVWQLFSQIRRLSANGATLLAARVAEATEWTNSGYATVEEWMAATTGTSIGAQKNEVTASGQLGDGLDETTDRMRQGTLSSEQGAIIADAASINPAAERALCDRAAMDSHDNLRREARKRKAQRQSTEDRAARHHRERRARRWQDSDDKAHFHVEGPNASLAGFFAAWEREIDRHYRDAQQHGRREGRDAYAFDAFMALTQRGMSSSDTPVTKPQHLAMIRVDLSALVRGSKEGEELCEIAGVGDISVPEARALLGESVLKLVSENGVDVQNITHLGRGPNAVQALAILWSEQQCQVLGCSRTHTEFDHRVDYRHTRHTRIDEIDRLCDHHHNLKTLHRWALVPGKGKRLFVPPDHPQHPNNVATTGAAPPDETATTEPAASNRATTTPPPARGETIYQRLARAKHAAQPRTPERSSPPTPRGHGEQGEQGDLFGTAD